MFPASLPFVLAQAKAPGLLDTAPLLIGVLFIFYLLVFRPQQKQMKEQQALLSSLKKGDDVITQGGILGKIFSVEDKIVTLEVASGVKLKMLKSSIQGRLPTNEPAKATDGDVKKEEK
ncbi:MAG: preprotein translocase subunit YajC [Myxococcota bacterium]